MSRERQIEKRMFKKCIQIIAVSGAKNMGTHNIQSRKENMNRFDKWNGSKQDL